MITGPIKQFKLVVIAVICGDVIAAAVGAYFHISSLKKTIATLEDQNSSLTANNKILQSNNDVLKENNKKFSAANESNLNTVKSLMNDRAASQKIINDLASAALRDKTQIDGLNTKLQDMLKDPKNDGPVAPVLKETVRNIQGARK